MRLICPDRPGFGSSDFQPDRRIVDWPAEVVALADSLGLGRFDVSPWGFEFGDIRSEVHLYHGDLDENVSPTMGRHQAEQIPDCVAHCYPEEGHRSLVVNCDAEILSPFV